MVDNGFDVRDNVLMHIETKFTFQFCQAGNRFNIPNVKASVLLRVEVTSSN